MIRQRPTMQVRISSRQSTQIAFRRIGALEGDSSVVAALLLAPCRYHRLALKISGVECSLTMRL